MIPFLLDEPSARKAVAKPVILARMVRAGWLKPVLTEHKVKVYAMDDLSKAVDRLKAGEALPPLPRSKDKHTQGDKK